MDKLRVLCRAITYDFDNHSILLVRNLDQSWWYVPGGGWTYGKESIIECASREVFEETGIKVNVLKLFYVQTIFIKEKNSTWLEMFWLAIPTGSREIPKDHVDEFGLVTEARWFNKLDLEKIVIYPEVIKENFWKNIFSVTEEDDRYVGHFEL